MGKKGLLWVFVGSMLIAVGNRGRAKTAKSRQKQKPLEI